MSKIVLIGANHAGTAAVNTILDHFPDNEVVVFDRNDKISFLGCGMALWIGGQIDGPDGLFYSNREKMENKGARVYMETEIQKIDFDGKKIHAKTKAGQEIVESYDKLILATGSLPISPDIPGKELDNVQFVKEYADAEQTIKRLEKPEIKSVAVVGAGYIGVELAEAFARHGKKVTMIDFAPTCLARYYDPEFNSLMRDNLKEHGIDLQFGQKVLELKGDGKRVTSVKTDKGEFPADMVVLAIGFRPNTALGKNDLELFQNGAYKVNLKQETSKKDVYAIGDCATVYDNASAQVSYIALASNAVRSGIVAGYNAAGVPLSGNGVQGSNGICIFGLNMVSTGMTLETARLKGFDAEHVDFEDLQKPGFMKDNGKVKIRIVYDKVTHRVLGAQLASREDIAMVIHMFSLAIEQRLTIDKLKLLDLFFLPHFNQPYNYITMAALSAE